MKIEEYTLAKSSSKQKQKLLCTCTKKELHKFVLPYVLMGIKEVIFLGFFISHTIIEFSSWFYRPCPSGYVCLPHVGDNPNYGFTSFDNLLWSMLTTFQLITLDYWENVYNMVSISCGWVVRDFKREAKTRCNFQLR